MATFKSKMQSSHIGVHAHQERQWLTDAAGATAHANLEAARGFGFLLCLGLGLGLGLGLRLSLGLGFGLGFWLRRCLCLALLAFRGRARVPISCDGRLFVLALVERCKLIVSVCHAVLWVNALLGHLQRNATLAEGDLGTR